MLSWRNASWMGRYIKLTHWGRVTHICVSQQTIIGSDNGLSPGRRQAIIWTNAGILLIGPLGTNFNKILIGVQTFSFRKMELKMSSAKWRPFYIGLNVLCSIISSGLVAMDTEPLGPIIRIRTGYTPPLKIPLISLWRWVGRRPYKVLSVISTNIAW